MKISKELQQKLMCPATGSRLRHKGEYLESVDDPSRRYPVIDDIPILIDDEKSLFSIDDFVMRANTTFDLNEDGLKQTLRRFIPDISVNVNGEKNYARLLSLLPTDARILVIGGSIKGDGMDAIYANKSFEIIGSDVSFGSYTRLISDAHDIPFENETFDCVIVQAVLEHVLDPQRCVNEVHRVLKSSGLVYAETPFMQQVHMKQYDFTRFTHLGHRRLFRRFVEIGSGPVCGPGMALAWSYSYFLVSFATSRKMARLINVFARFTSFYLKYFDYYLIDKPGSYDAASGFYFMGRKSDQVLSDRDLIKQFRGFT